MSEVKEQSFLGSYWFYVVLSGYVLLLLFLASKVDSLSLLIITVFGLVCVFVYKYLLNYLFKDSFAIVELVRKQVCLKWGSDFSNNLDVTSSEVREYPPNTNNFLVYFFNCNWLFVFDNKIGKIINHLRMTINDYVVKYDASILAPEITKKLYLENIDVKKKELEQGGY